MRAHSFGRSFCEACQLMSCEVFMKLVSQKTDPLTIAFDFDGVIHHYTTFADGLNPPVPGVIEFMRMLKELGHTIIIHTVRGLGEIGPYLVQYGVPYDYFNENPEDRRLAIPTGNPGKPRADVYIDDRARRFDGICDEDFVLRVLDAKSWVKR